jgi:hypothetical protein
MKLFTTSTLLGSRKLVAAIGSIVPQTCSTSGQTSSTQDRQIPVSGNQNARMHGHTYKSESWPSQPSGPSRPSRPSQPSGPSRPSRPSQPLRPPVAAKRSGYTQNHAHYQDHLAGWSGKASPSGNVQNVVAVLVCVGVVHPGQKKIVIIDVSVHSFTERIIRQLHAHISIRVIELPRRP